MLGLVLNCLELYISSNIAFYARLVSTAELIPRSGLFIISVGEILSTLNSRGVG